MLKQLQSRFLFIFCKSHRNKIQKYDNRITNIQLFFNSMINKTDIHFLLTDITLRGLKTSRETTAYK